MFKTFPNTGALLLVIIVFCAALTYIIPAGEFKRVRDESLCRTIVVADSFHYVEKRPVGLKDLFSSIFNGLLKASDIISFVFVVGGSISIVIKSGAITVALASIIQHFKDKTHILIPIIMTSFAFGGATFGMGEETLPFVAILIATACSIGYDRIIGVSMVTLGVFAGYAAGPLNPFSIGIAHTVAELPIFSGMGLRTVLCIGGLIIAIHHTMKYAAMIKADPSKSLVAGIPFQSSVTAIVPSTEEISFKHKLILYILMLTMGGLLVGVLMYEWYLAEISALFMFMGVLVGFISYGTNINIFVDDFIEGAKELASAAILIGFSRAILVIMENGMIMDTIIRALSLPLIYCSNVIAAIGMFFIQGVINFFIPSSSGQAVVVMPIMAPLADLIGISRQVACQAYQSGDGYWNMITPTHPILVASLGIAGVPFGKWFKYAAPLVIKWSIWTCIILIIGVYIW